MLLAGQASPSVAGAAARPKVTSVSIGELSQAESTTMDIKGSGFTSGAKVNLGNGIVTTVISLSGVRITVGIRVDPHAPVGTRSVTVTDPGGASGALNNAVHVAYVPVLTRWAVGDGAAGWSTTLARPLFSSLPRVSFSGGGVDVVQRRLDAKGHLDLRLSVGQASRASWRTMTLTQGASSWIVAHGIRVRAAPVIDRIGAMARGTTQTVVVVGKNFEVCQHSLPGFAFSGTGVTVNKVIQSLGSVLYLNLSVDPAAPYGPRDVTMTNCDSGGVSVNKGVFTVTGPPTVTSIPPIAVGVNRVETVVGYGFAPSTVLRASGTGVALTGTFYVSPTKLYVRVTVDPAAAAGPRDVTATNANGKTSTAAGVLVIDPLPTLASITPATIVAGAAQTESLTGTGFGAGATISVGAKGSQSTRLAESAVVVSSPGSLHFELSADASLAPGTYDVRLVNQDGGAATLFGQLASVVQLAKPTGLVVTPSSQSAGSLNLRFAPPPNAPPGQGYAALVCTNAALTTGCVRDASVRSGSEVSGLVAGSSYYVAVAATASSGYLASVSATVGPVRATDVLAAPTQTVVRFGALAGSVIVSFTGTLHAPASQTYTVRACRDAAMSVGCVTSSRFTSGQTLAGLAYARGSAGPTYFVTIRANPSTGHLASGVTPVVSHADTSQLTAPTILWANSPNAGRIKVGIRAGTGRPPTSFSVRACRNVAMTQGCVRAAHFTSGGDLTGLARGQRYWVVATSEAPTGFLSSNSAVHGPVTVA